MKNKKICNILLLLFANNSKQISDIQVVSFDCVMDI